MSTIDEEALGSRNLSIEELRALTGWQRILYHLKRYGEITPMQAWQLYGVYRLGAAIWRLKRGKFCKQRYPIVTEEVDVPNRFQEQVTTARYRLVRP
jgi:hypothetical protein